MNQDKNENLEILLTEYRTLKDEEKSIFSFQFTIIGVCLTFLGVMINSLFNQVKENSDVCVLELRYLFGKYK